MLDMQELSAILAVGYEECQFPFRAPSLYSNRKITYGGSSKMAVNLTPLHDRVIVKRIEEKETVKGGIIIPDSAKEKPMEGEVIAVGAGKREKGELIPLDVKPGDRVLFGKYGGTEIKLDDEEYLILREEEILAKLSGAAKAAKK
jgi:chaperonin GroES